VFVIHAHHPGDRAIEEGIVGHRQEIEAPVYTRTMKCPERCVFILGPDGLGRQSREGIPESLTRVRPGIGHEISLRPSQRDHTP
jgi:hypothetical protein